MIDSKIFESRILIADDNAVNILIVEQFLKWAGYTNLRSVSDSTTVLDTFRQFKPDLLILDLHMPHVDGYRILTKIRNEQKSRSFMPILVLTADGTKDARNRALELGASDFLTKPGDPTEILLRVQNFLRTRHMHLELEYHNRALEERVLERTNELLLARFETLECLANAAEYRDDVTGKHTQRVGETSAVIARNLGLQNDMVELIRLAAPLHDIGKIGIPDGILLKPDKLTNHEFNEMKRHVTIGSGILAQGHSPVIKMAREIALYHHEKWNGLGYVQGLSGEDIPLPARIVAVADAFDALTHDRPYQAAKSEEEACSLLCESSGSHFDPRVLQAFIDAQPASIKARCMPL